MSLRPVFTSSLGWQGTAALWLRWPYPDYLFFFFFGAITWEKCECNQEQALHIHSTVPALFPPGRAAGALPLPAGRAPALPALGASSARVQLRIAGSLESLPNQAFCSLAQVAASRGR